MGNSLDHSRENDRYRDWATEMTTINTVVMTSFGALAILNQLMTMGALIAANILSGKLIAPLVQLVTQWRMWGQFLAARKRLDDLLGIELDRVATDVQMAKPRGELLIEKVSFSYPGSKHPQIVELAGQIGLIDGPLAVQVADAYRTFRKLQHQIRLRGDDRARVDPGLVRHEVDAVTQLWQQVIL